MKIYFELNKNRKIGLLIIGIGLLISYIIYSFNRALNTLYESSMIQCAVDGCPHEAALAFHTNISLIILALVIGTGIVFLFLKEKKVISKKEDTEKIKSLDDNERKLYNIIKGEGSIFQSDLVEKVDFDKVKVTRILDKLEGKQLIERKRRGMTNVIILK